MFNWLTGLFGSNKNQPIEVYEVTENGEWLKEQIERIQAEEEHRHWLFIVGLASELFPGDNKAVDRVEAAVKAVLSKITDNRDDNEI